jgi:acyl transferase domain-containing protein/acyl carrier protein
MEYAHDGIALIGIGCRFPRADGPAELWNLLCQGVDAITEPPESRLACYREALGANAESFAMLGGFLRDVDHFDASFFNISPSEAQCMDPQQRLALEVAWEALSDAGQAPQELSGTQTGVFMGAIYSDYQTLLQRSKNSINAYTGTGGALSIIANRISYSFNLRGPSLVVDTACSSSLVAVHLACKSLLTKECSIALAGGVNLMLLPMSTFYFRQAGLLAPDGRCKSFDRAADGFVRGEGAGIVVLKRLADAIAANDRIYAVLRGSALNQDGHTNGLTAPSRWSQVAVLKSAYQDAGVDPHLVQYVEAHGSGTAFGDQIEAAALGEVIGGNMRRYAPCAIGSIKTNIGHLEAAAGIAGLIKVALMLRNRVKPASLHCSVPSPQARFSEIGLRVQSRLEDFERRSTPLLAGVSSFGFGGTNAHVVMEEAPTPGLAGDQTTGSHLLAFSAHRQPALASLLEAYADFLSDPGVRQNYSLTDICSAASRIHGHLMFRAAVVGDSHADMHERLQEFRKQGVEAGLVIGQAQRQRPRIVFVCPGQGGQWAGMGRQLLETEPVFRQVVEQCDQAMQDEVSWSLLEKLESGELDAQVDVVQPQLFAVEIGLGELWRSWGIKPAAVVGHSVGEVAASYLAGALSLGEAIKVVCRRSRLLGRLRGRGAMLAVEVSELDSLRWLQGYERHVSIAASNSPGTTVWSGEREALEKLRSELERRGVFCRWVKVEVAAHSPQVDELEQELEIQLGELELRSPEVALYSTVTGELLDTQLDAGYWICNLRKPVRFRAAIECMRRDGYDTFVELSPHPTLLPAIEETVEMAGAEGLVVGSLRREEDERRALLESLGALWVRGSEVDWERVQGRHRPVSLPRYPWQRERFWIESSASADVPALIAHGNSPGHENKVHELLGTETKIAGTAPVRIWQSLFDLHRFPWVKDHKVFGVPVLPAAAFVEMALAAGHELYGRSSPIRLSELSLHRMFALSERSSLVQTNVVVSSGSSKLEIHSWDETAREWVLHCSTLLEPNEPADPAPSPSMPSQTGASVPISSLYDRFREAGMEYGPTFRVLKTLSVVGDSAVGFVETSASLDDSHYHTPPPLLDCGFHVVAGLFENLKKTKAAFVPVAIRSIEFRRDLPADFTAMARCDCGIPENSRITADIWFFDGEADPVGRIQGLSLMALDELAVQSTTGRHADSANGLLFEVQWREQELAPSSGREERPSAWLIFGGNTSVGQALATVLAENGQRAIMVETAGRYERIRKDAYFIRDDSESDIQTLLDELEPNAPIRILNCSSLETGIDEESSGREAEEREFRKSLSLAFIARTISKRAGCHQLWVATSGTQSVIPGGKGHAVAGSSLWGAGRVIANEHPEVWGGLIDLDPADSPAEAARRVCSEILAARGEPQVAYRADKRFVARFTPCKLNPAAFHRFDSGAVYVITGGTGALGREVAQWMVSRGARQLLVISRRPPSDRSWWNALGAEVEFAQINIADEGAVSSLLGRFGPGRASRIRGVVHAAGLLSDRTISELDADSFRIPFRPKVGGAWVLHKCLREAKLDFFVLFSSAASVLGSPGQAAYSAANAFMDSLAHYRRALGFPAMSVNWGPWKETGLAAEEERTQHLKALGVRLLKSQDALGTLEALMSWSPAQVTVLSLDWPRFRQTSFGNPASPLFREAASPTTALDGTKNSGLPAALRGELIAATRSDRRRLLQEFVTAQLARELRIAPAEVRLDLSLAKLGMNSLMAISFRIVVERMCGVLIPVQDLLRSDSVNDLIDFVLDHLPPGVAIEKAQTEGGQSEAYEIVRF